MRKKIIMLLSNAFDPDPRVLQEAKSLIKADYDLTILCWDRDLKSPPEELLGKIKIKRIFVRSTHGRGPTQILYLVFFWFMAFLEALKIRFDFVHCHDFDTLPLGFFLSRIRRCKLIYDSHESYGDMIGNNVPNLIKRFIFKFEDMFLPRLDLLITVGEILAQTFKDRGAMNVCVVGNWKNPKEFIYSDKLIREEKSRLNISNSQIVLCFIANLGFQRQIPILLKAVEESPNIFLIIGGDGPEKKHVVKASQRVSNIHYLGYVDPSKVSFYTALSDAIIYSYNPKNPNARFSAPNKLFEGLAAGKVIITGDFGEIGKIVRETRSGVILNTYTNENIKSTFSSLDTAGIKKFKQNSKRAAEKKYSWREAEKILINHYNEII